MWLWRPERFPYLCQGQSLASHRVWECWVLSWHCGDPYCVPFTGEGVRWAFSSCSQVNFWQVPPMECKKKKKILEADLNKPENSAYAQTHPQTAVLLQSYYISKGISHQHGKGLSSFRCRSFFPASLCSASSLLFSSACPSQPDLS